MPRVQLRRLLKFSARRVPTSPIIALFATTTTAAEKPKWARNLYPKAPDMRQSQTQKLTDGQIYYIIHNGIRLTGMPAWGTDEKDEDSWKLVAFIRHLPEVTPEERREMEQLNPKTDSVRAEERDEERFLNEGKSPQVKGNRHR
jgi:hypothetical protein